MSLIRYVEVDKNEAGQRLDNYLIRELKGVPKSHVYRLIRSGQVRVNKKRAKVGTHVQQGDIIRIPPVRVAEKQQVFVGERLNRHLLSCIIYEDDYVLAINKPAGFAVHGGTGLALGVIEALRHIRADLPNLSLAHRLDKETSGCLLFAKDRPTLLGIHELLVARDVKKTYWAILENTWDRAPSYMLEAALQKHQASVDGPAMRVSDEGKNSVTQYKLKESFKQACWMEVYPKTGRMHQIRVHSAYLGHPVMGDSRYGALIHLGKEQPVARRLYLHARTIQFNLHGRSYKIEAELDETFVKALSTLRATTGD